MPTARPTSSLPLPGPESADSIRAACSSSRAASSNAPADGLGTLRFPDNRRNGDRSQSSLMGHRTVVAVLIASMVVAGALAWQAATAARHRQAASDAMLRQSAQLAAWEF